MKLRQCGHQSVYTSSAMGLPVCSCSFHPCSNPRAPSSRAAWTDGAIIISSDREVARFAEKKGCGVLGSHEFDRVLNEPMGLEEEEEEEGEKQGSAYRPKKARRKALARLREPKA